MRQAELRIEQLRGEDKLRAAMESARAEGSRPLLQQCVDEAEKLLASSSGGKFLDPGNTMLSGAVEECRVRITAMAVSYTHLTLPTILLV